MTPKGNNLLIAVKSCWPDRDAGFHDPIRNTWGARRPAYTFLRFFVGAGGIGSLLYPNEIQIDAGDDYHALPFKTKAILTWFLDRNLDYIFLCDTDTYVIIPKLIECGFEKYDYMGVNGREWGKTFSYDAPNRDGVNYHLSKCWPWCSGGFGYFLSRKAAEFIIKETPTIWAEDMFVGQVLGPLIASGEIRAGNLQQSEVAYHYTRTKENWNYKPELKWMEAMHKKYGGSCGA